MQDVPPEPAPLALPEKAANEQDEQPTPPEEGAAAAAAAAAAAENAELPEAGPSPMEVDVPLESGDAVDPAQPGQHEPAQQQLEVAELSQAAAAPDSSQAVPAGEPAAAVPDQALPAPSDAARQQTEELDEGEIAG